MQNINAKKKETEFKHRQLTVWSSSHSRYIFGNLLLDPTWYSEGFPSLSRW